jgi:hypothetical protein
MESIAQREKWAALSGWKGDGSTNELAMQTEESIDDVLLTKQKYIVFQIAQTHTQIKSYDGKPWIRVIGFVKTLDDARTLASKTYDDCDKAETRIMPCGRNFLIGKTKYEGLDLPRREEEQKKSNTMVENWIENRLQIIRDTELRAKTLSKITANNSDSMSESANSIDSKEDIIWPEEKIQIQSETKSEENVLPIISEQVPVPFMQRYFAMAVIPDSDPEINEPSVIALWAMETEQDQKNKLLIASKSKDLIHFDIQVGPTGVWLPLSSNEKGKIQHHNPLRQSLEDNIKWGK